MISSQIENYYYTGANCGKWVQNITLSSRSIYAILVIIMGSMEVLRKFFQGASSHFGDITKLSFSCKLNWNSPYSLIYSTLNVLL